MSPPDLTCTLDRVRSTLTPTSLDVRSYAQGRSERYRRKSDCESDGNDQIRFRKVKKGNQGVHVNGNGTTPCPDRIRYHRYPASRLCEQQLRFDHVSTIAGAGKIVHISNLRN